MERGRVDVIDRNSSVPIYRQLKEIIKRRITRGEFRPGERISTEYELCREFSISRTSVRQALTELTQEGYLYRHQGSGTFVNHRDGGRHTTVRVMIPEAHWAPYLRRAAAAMDGTRPRVEIEVLGRPHLRDKLLAAIGRGDAPDLALIDWAWVAEFANLHFLVPLDQLAPDWAAEYRNDVFPAVLDVGAPALYGAQPEVNVAVVWYRRDRLTAAGLSPPRTWDDLVQICLHFRKEDRFPLAFVAGQAAGETTTYQLLPFLWAAGGQIINGGRAALGMPAQTTLTFLSDLVHRYHVAAPRVVSYAWDQPARLFAAGDATLAVGGSYEKQLIQQVAGWTDAEFRRHVGCVPIPAPAGRTPTTVAGGMVYVIFRQSKDPRAAAELLTQVVGPELMYTFCSRTGRTPTRQSVVHRLDPARSWFSHRVSELLPFARARIAIPEYARVSEQFQLMVESVISGRTSPAAAVKHARAVIDALIR